RIGGITRLLRVLLVAVVALPITLFAVASWLNYLAAFQQGRQSVFNATDAINQHAQKVFETAELILGQVTERGDDLGWSTIARCDALHRLLVDLGKRPRIAVVGLIGPDGTVVADNLAFPLTPISLSERNYVSVDRPGAGPLLISSLANSVFTGRPDFI